MNKILSMSLLAASVLLAAPVTFANERDVEIGAIHLAKAYSQSNNAYQLMSVDELKSALDNNEALLLIDTMGSESYKKQHVPTAINFTFPPKLMPEWDTSKTEGKTEADFRALLGPDKDKKIIIHCGFVMCPRSHTAIAWALKMGYKNIHHVPGGVNAWRDSGYTLITESSK